MEFRDAWQKVGEFEGQTLHTDRGEVFSYRFRKTYVVVSPGDISIPRTNFEKIFRRLPDVEQAAAPAVQGQRFITAIFGGVGITEMD
jgi:hypothetical protein